MSKRGPKTGAEQEGGGLRWATLGGVVLVLIVGVLSLQELREIRREFGKKLGALDTQVAQLQTKVESAAKAPAQRGPDPNKAYSIKTAGAPYKGNPNAPVTIAEFSDFQ